MPKEFIRKLTGKTRSTTHDIQLGIILAFIAGAINAGGFMAVGQYTSHMTGIASTIAEDIILNKFDLALTSLRFLSSFIFGAVVSAYIINIARTRQLQSEFAAALMLEAFLLLIFGLLATKFISSSLNSTISLLCFIMGLQNAIITKISRAEIRTTHVTGISTDIGIEIGKILYFWKEKSLRVRMYYKRLQLHFSLLLSFIVGGIFGSLSFKYFGFATTLPLAFVLVVLASVPIIDDLKKTKVTS